MAATRVQHVYRDGFQAFLAATSGTLSGTPASGNLLFAFVFIGDDGTGRTVTPPSGWTAFSGSPFHSGTNYTVAAYWKLATGSESTTYSWSWTQNSTIQTIYLSEWTGVDASTPIDVQGSAWTDFGLSAGPVSVPAITTVTDNAIDLVVCNQQHQGPGYSLSGYTAQNDAAAFGVFSKTITPAGTTGARSVSLPTNHFTDAFSFAIRPGAPPPPAPDPDTRLVRRSRRPGSPFTPRGDAFRKAKYRGWR